MIGTSRASEKKRSSAFLLGMCFVTLYATAQSRRVADPRSAFQGQNVPAQVGAGAPGQDSRKAAPSLQQLEAEKYFKQGEQLVGTADENSDRQIALFERALELDPTLMAAEFNLGIIYSRLRDGQKALTHFNRVLEKAPPSSSVGVNARYLAALNLKELGRSNEAKERLQEVLAANPKHADALSLLGGIYLEEGEMDPAKAVLEQAVQGDTKVPEAFYNLAFLSQKEGQTTEALKYYEKFVELVPTNATAQLNMAILLAGADRMEEATKYAQKAVQLDPSNAEAWIELGKIQTLTDKQEEAQDSFRHSIQLQPKWSEAHRLLVNLLSKGSKLAEVNSVLEESLKSNPDESEIYTLKGEWATRAGDLLSALRAYGRAHELNPTASTTFDLAMVYARSGMDPLAEEYFTQAVKMKPDFGEAWFNLGILKDRQKRAADALAAYRQAEANGIQEAKLWYRMGFLYAQLQDAEKALVYLAKAIQTDPPHWKAALREDLKAVTSELDSIRYKPEFQKLLE
ncbi:MAG: tetratricopeptide repeat protein [Acidobacteria bacterium]|nr:tetratricopeptide repeat protein [Acidobacteriota bacterium]